MTGRFPQRATLPDVLQHLLTLMPTNPAPLVPVIAYNRIEGTDTLHALVRQFRDRAPFIPLTPAIHRNELTAGSARFVVLTMRQIENGSLRGTSAAAVLLCPEVGWPARIEREVVPTLRTNGPLWWLA